MSDAQASDWADTSRQGPPESQTRIDTIVARSLLAGLRDHVTAISDGSVLAAAVVDGDLGERFDGWDMAVFRLGDGLALRLPRTASAVVSLDVEVRVIRDFGQAWSFPHPRIVHVGQPNADFPWPWAITTWLEGMTADLAPLSASAGIQVGAALASVHRPADPDAPFNLEQSLGLAERSDQLEWALALVLDREGPRGERLDVAAARELWAEALAAPGPGAPVWSHADAHGSNLLGIDGAFAGIIDWGKASACDPAVDLAFLYTAMPAGGVADAFLAYRTAGAGSGDAGLEARARGIALTKAAAWATLSREVNVAMAWRALGGLGVLA